MSDLPEIHCERHGRAGVVTLDRPAALNALTLGMVEELARALAGWAADPHITRVVVTGAGDRAFCAGGDVRHLYELGQRGAIGEALDFWRKEYALNIAIKRFPKPYVALIDGIVMGGGVGVSLHGSHRVAGERYAFAMPEVGIGFFPDVGASWALPRLPRRAGRWLALTGERIRAADAVALGLADAYVPMARMVKLTKALLAGEPIEAAITAQAHDPGHAAVLDDLVTIERCFAPDDLPGILTLLDAAADAGSAFALRAANTMRTKSPTSLAIALEQMLRGERLSFEEAMAMEFRIVSRVAAGREFSEGVRAAIIDKDQKPFWRPATIGEIDSAAIAAYFEPLGPDELARSPQGEGA